MANNRQIIFLLKCIESNSIKFDFATVSSATGLTPNAARMRYTRLRASFQEHLEDIEPRVTTQSTRPSSKSFKTSADRKRRLSDIEESDEYNVDNESRKEREEEGPPLKKRLRSATQQQSSDIASGHGSVHNHESEPSDPTAFVDTKLLKKMNKPMIPSDMSYAWPILATDPRKRTEYTSSDDADNQLKTELMDDIKRTLAENGRSIDDLVRMNVEKSTHIFPPNDPVQQMRYVPGLLDKHDPPLSIRASIEMIAAHPPLPIPNYEANLLENEFEYGYDDNVNSEIVHPSDSLSEVLQRKWTERHDEHIRQKRAAEIQAARRGRINKIISFILRRGDEEDE